MTRFINAAVTNFNRKKRSGPNNFRLNFDESVDIILGTSDSQNKWPTLNPETFEEDLVFLWNKVKAATRIPRGMRADHEALEQLKCDRMQQYKFHFFVFLPKIGRDMVNNRVSQRNTRQAIEDIQQVLNRENSSIDIVPNGIAHDYWVQQQARNPQSSPVPPSDLTMRQAQYIDQHTAVLNRSVNEDEVVLNVKVNGGDPIKMTFQVAELRRAVGLPDFPIIDLDIFRQNNSPLAQPLDPDRPDDDHISTDVEEE